MAECAFGTRWIVELAGEDFLAVCDVTIDIARERRRSHRDVVHVPLLQSEGKFFELMPADSPQMRDRYCDLRWKAAQRLARHGALDRVGIDKASHRFLEVRPVPGIFERVAQAVQSELAARTRPSR